MFQPSTLAPCSSGTMRKLQTYIQRQCLVNVRYRRNVLTANFPSHPINVLRVAELFLLLVKPLVLIVAVHHALDTAGVHTSVVHLQQHTQGCITDASEARNKIRATEKLDAKWHVM